MTNSQQAKLDFIKTLYKDTPYVISSCECSDGKLFINVQMSGIISCYIIGKRGTIVDRYTTSN